MGNKNSTEQAAEPPKPSYYTMIKQSYQQLLHAIIRPPRSNYLLTQLGPENFNFCGKKFHRNDFVLRNPRGLQIVCSLWEPSEEDRVNPVLPCVIYMHGNSSSRLEALPQLSLVLSLGATLLAFDFSGSGLSEGEYVSLGTFEKDDLQTVIEHLRTNGTTSTIALWGRSMGAATALLHGERDPSIAGMILDSAYTNLIQLAEEIIDKGRQNGLFAPNFAVKFAVRFVRSSVLKAANFDIRQVCPIDKADRCFIPALFVAAEHDMFVAKHHSEQIFEMYGGDKNIVIVEGDHNSPRPKFLYDSAAIFLLTTLQIPAAWSLPDGQNYTRKLPWSVSSSYNYQDSFEYQMEQRLYDSDLSRSVRIRSGVGQGGVYQQYNREIDGETVSGINLDGLNASDLSEDDYLALQYMASLGDEDSELAQLVREMSCTEGAMQQDVQASLLGFMSAGTGQHKTGKNGGVVSSGQGDCRSPTEENGKVSPPSSCALEIKPIKVDPDLPFINESGDRRSYDLNKEKRNSRGKRANSSDQRPSSQRMLLSEPISRTSSIDKDIDQRMVWRDTDQKRASVWACTSCSSLNESGEGICKSCGVGKFSKH